MKIQLLSLAFFMSMIACNKKNASTLVHSDKHHASGWKNMEILASCRFDEGEYGELKIKTVDVVDFEGIVAHFSDQVLIKSSDGVTSYLTCNAPDLADNTVVKISGELRKIPLNFRMPGTPLKLTKLAVKE